MPGSVAVIGAPSAIGIRPYDQGGVRRLDLTPGVLREQGLVARLRAIDLGDVKPPFRYSDMVRPVDRVRNEDDVAAYSRKLASRIARASGAGHFIVLLGGDCSVMLGALLGLKQAGKKPVGLVYADAHSDFATLDESPSGSACSMNLALAVGRADTPLARLSGDGPLLRGDYAVHVGRRDEEHPEYGYPALSQFGLLDIPQVRVAREGIEAVTRAAVERMSRLAVGFWIHFDADILDPELMPAVDSPLPGGLDFTEAAKLLTRLVAHPLALGLQLTIYDSTIDPDSSGAIRLVELVEQAVTGRS